METDFDRGHFAGYAQCLLDNEITYEVKIKRKKLVSGYMQKFVSLKIGSMEFEREYQTIKGAEKAVDKLKKILNTERHNGNV